MDGLGSVSGLASGLDWRSLIDQLRAVEHRPIDLITNRKTNVGNKLKAWQDLNTRLLALKTSAEKLKDAGDFNLYSSALSSSSATKAEELLTASVGSAAGSGSYALEVLQTARAQKVSGKSFTSQSAALGVSFDGSFIINGRSVTISATDTLANVRDKINNLNSGTNATKVTASIVSYSPTDYRLVLSSQEEGAAGLGLQQAGSANLLETFGLITATRALKNASSNGANSDAFGSSGTAVYSLLGMSGPTSGNVTINGQNLTVDLSKTLTQIAADIDALNGVSAQVVPSTQNGLTVYRLAISGTTSVSNYTDAGNVLQSLGILKGTFGSVSEVHLSDKANTRTTAAGGGNVTAGATWESINTGGDANNVTNGDTIAITGTKHDGTAVSGTYTITNKTTETIQGLLTQIDTLFGLTPGSAVVVEGKIRITDSTSGDSLLSIGLVANNQAGAGLDLGTLAASTQGYAMELQSGRDAQLKVDGNYLTRPSNTITDVITGVTLNLKKPEIGTTVTLNVSRDTDGLVNLIKDFVDKYNSVMGFIQTQSSYDTEKKQPGGVLFGEGTLRSVKTDLIDNLVNPVWGVSSQFSIMGMVGVNLDSKGSLSVNEDTLKGYLQTNFEDIRKLFVANGSATAGTLNYVGHGLKTKAGTYAVNISQAATRGTVTGSVDLGGGLGQNTTLTLGSGGASVKIGLTSGMTLAQIVSAVNSELDQAYAEVIVGDRQLYADAGMIAKISNATSWANVYDDTGTSAGLQDGDTITFSGTNRSGTSVSGSYTVSNAGTGTVQGLLSAIESAYSNNVTASIDGNGRISLTDKTAGTSQISLSITGPAGRNLDFGTINVDPTGADGSRDGRFAVAVTASASADNKLVLTHDNYGSASGFSVTANALLGFTDTTYSGLDVVGTINGEAATGSGQTLTGNSGAAHVEGLALTYTGSATGAMGDLTFTQGAADLFNRSLFYITDDYEGYLSFKEKSIEDSVDTLETKISRMEVRLDQKMERLTRQFIAMERIVSTLKNQSNWLAGQISSLNR